MEPDIDLHNQIASALTGLIKQIKAIRYYPSSHPALQTSARETLRGFEPLLASGNHLSLTVRKEGFLFDDQPVAKGNQVLTQLATFCFARRIQHLTILADLRAGDLHHFVHYLLLDPQEIQKHGGIQALLEKGRVTTIWANIQDLEAILERKEEIEAEEIEQAPDPATVIADGAETTEVAEGEAPDLVALIDRLEKEQNDQRFARGLQELIPLARINMTEGNRQAILRAYLLLCRSATGKQSSEIRRENSRQALEQLTGSEMVDYLLDYLLDDSTAENVRTVLIKVLLFLRNQVVERMMGRLAEEDVASRRKLLADVMIKIGPAAIPILQEYLADERWFVVRNAVAILGEIRSQEALQHLTPLLRHDEVRVRRETIRALTKIGGQRAINILLQAAEESDQEMRRQAIISLGAIRAESAVPTLLKILRQKDRKQKTIELKKDTIRALGEIRSGEAVPELVDIARKRRLLNRAQHDELRVVAAGALGDIGEGSVRDMLEKLTDDRSAQVARAAATALKQIDKANPDKGAS